MNQYNKKATAIAFIKTMAADNLPCIITGPNGGTKKDSIIQALDKYSLNDYTVVECVTVPQLVKALYNNKDKRVVIQKCNYLLTSPTAIRIIKSVLDNNQVTHELSSFDNIDKIPNSFSFNRNNLIIMSETPMAAVPKIIKDRMLNIIF